MANLFNLPEVKRCKICKEIKPLTEYRQRGPNAYNNQCKSCLYARDAALLRASPVKKAKSVIANKKIYARDNRLDFDLTVEWYLKKVRAGFCEATGMPIRFNHDYGNTANWYEPNIDRIIPGGDYTKANCRVVCRMFNMARSDFPEEMFYKMCKGYVDRVGTRYKKAA